MVYLIFAMTLYLLPPGSPSEGTAPQKTTERRIQRAHDEGNFTSLSHQRAGAIRMLRQLLVSIAVSVGNIAIHAVIMAAVLWVRAWRMSAPRRASRFDGSPS